MLEESTMAMAWSFSTNVFARPRPHEPGLLLVSNHMNLTG